MEKKLYKSKTDKKLCGVCGGLAKYFDMDPTIIRVLWVLCILFGGSGVVAYIVCAILFPEEPENLDYNEVEIN